MISTVADTIRVQGVALGKKPAITYGERIVTFEELDLRSSRVANGLLAEGVETQDRVAFLDKNSPEFFDVLFGAAKVKAVTVAVNWRLHPREAAYIVNDAEARLLVVGEQFVPLLNAMVGELTTVKKILVVGRSVEHEGFEEWLDRQDPADPGCRPAGDDVALQFYSSGTTGLPKGVMLTNDNCFAAFGAAGNALGFHDDSVALVAMPLFHVSGGYWGLAALHYGVTSVLEREVDPARLVRVIGEHRITHALLVPSVIQFMLQVPGINEAEFPALEYMVYAGSPISEDVLKAALPTFGCKFLQGYGMTETSGAVTFLPPSDHDPDGPLAHRLRSAGRPVPGCALRVVDPDTLEDVALGAVGEILVRSAQNMKGYWKRPDDTARTLLPGGWLRTGDAGYLDGDGYLYIHDRIQDMIISGGENIYPAEVENVLMSHPAVADVAVIGVPSERWGETPKALVVLAPGTEVTEEELLEFATRSLARYKCPMSLEWRESLPRNASGKVLKKDLRAPYWQGRTRQVN